MRREDFWMKKELEILLERYSPSQLDRIYLAACPKFKERRDGVPQIYQYMHDAALSRLLTEIRLRIDVAMESEKNLNFGRVDDFISIALNDRPLLTVEVKIGGVKVVQPAVYSFLTGMKVVVAEMRTGSVFVIDVETAREILKSLLRHIHVRGALKMRQCIIPGRECYLCGENCSFRKNGRMPNPLRHYSSVMSNVERVAERIVEILKAEMDARNHEVEVKAYSRAGGCGDVKEEG